ncbi:MAG: Fic family protein [Cetobacterium sp.]
MEKYFEEFTEVNYYSESELKYRVEKTKIEKVWNDVVNFRKKNGYTTSFESQEGTIFFYYIRKIIKENIHKLESSSKINLTDRKLAKKVYSESLIDEAMSSSAIEGAFSTRRRTKDLVEGCCIPETKDEKMILNNYNALKFINENNDVLITDELVIELHNIIIFGTLDECDITERYRDDLVVLKDANNKEVYEAPKCELVEELMSQLIDYINEDTKENVFIKASIIQFMFLYIHPFFDGNGRTGRALSYMYLIKKGYGFFKFFSISYVVNEYKSKYYKSILKCEDEYSDLSYFIDFNIDMMSKAVSTTVKKYSKLLGVTEATSINHLSYFVKNKIFKKIEIGNEKIYIMNKLEDFIELNNKN